MTSVIGGAVVTNAEWSFDDTSDPLRYIYTYTGNLGVFPGGTDSIVGIKLRFVRSNVAGEFSVGATLPDLVGGEAAGSNGNNQKVTVIGFQAAE